MKKSAITTVLKKGELTGEAVGKLVLKHYLVKQNTGKDLFADDEKTRLVNGLRNRNDLLDFKGYVELTFLLCNCIVASKIQSLSASRRILVVLALINMTQQRTEDKIISFLSPTIMTNSEYKRKTAAYKAERLKDEITLEEAFFYRLEYYVDHQRILGSLWKTYKTSKEVIARRELTDYEGVDADTDLLEMEFYGEADSGFDLGLEEIREDFPELFSRIAKELQNPETGFRDKDFSKLSVDKARTVTTTRKQLLAAGMSEHKELLLLESEYSGGIAILRKPLERQLNESGEYHPAFLDKKPVIDAEKAEALSQVIQQEILGFVNLKAVAQGIASLVGVDQIKLINEDEEELRNNLELLRSVAMDATASDPDIVSAYEKFGEINIPSVDEATAKVASYLRQSTPAQYSDLTDEKMIIETNWVEENSTDNTENDVQ